MMKTTVSILEVNLISAQQLVSNATKSRRLQTYVAAYIDYNKKSKVSSRIDGVGNQNPTWNDKFIFSVDLELLTPTSCIVFQIYKVGNRMLFQKDKRIGVVRVLVEDLLKNGCSTHKFMGCHVRKPRSGLPQGILNIGVVVISDGILKQAMKKFLGSNYEIDYRSFLGESGGL
ncbi:Calcium-dependent lipid-binding domain-containing protein [Melia azedarach]|uniref:Calcium-dependent lipid-binding domain-containing protein n=1 Tax=Melia azedarach TaxID=155640 RepID=A0ACC1YD61_MELAZ|nr:Calcium-dependent lipid-binding domain-containing protein [Melia azedarach]